MKKDTYAKPKKNLHYYKKNIYPKASILMILLVLFFLYI